MTLKGLRRWPHLASLCGGYLHEDFAAEHGSVSKAVQAWLDEANHADARALSSEWRTFLNLTRGMDAAARADTLRDLLGGAWAPASAEEFEAVSALLMNAWKS